MPKTHKMFSIASKYYEKADLPVEFQIFGRNMQLGRVHTKYVIIGVNGDYGRAVQKDQG
jgi:hypothetical protein